MTALLNSPGAYGPTSEGPLSLGLVAFPSPLGAVFSVHLLVIQSAHTHNEVAGAEHKQCACRLGVPRPFCFCIHDANCSTLGVIGGFVGGLHTWRIHAL